VPPDHAPHAPVTLPDPPPLEVLRHNVAAYEGIGWVLAPLRTYAGAAGEIRQHPPREWQLSQGSIAGALVDGSGRVTYGLALVLGPSGVVDLDLDSDAARDLAPIFLRPTITFGRKGRITHYLYSCPAHKHPDNGGPKDQRRTRAFANPWGGGKATLLELRRGPGQQTVLPPTLKPDGAPAVWTDGCAGLAAWEDGDEIRVEDLALASLIATEPMVGGRHDSAMRWAGELARRGVDQERAERVLMAAFERRGDAGMDDRARVIGDTYARHAAGESIKGITDRDVGRSLDAIVGKAVAAAQALAIATATAKATAEGKVPVCVSLAMDLVLAAIGEAFAAADPPPLFVQGGLVTIDGVASVHRLVAEAAKVGHFYRHGKEGAEIVAHPTRELLATFAAAPPASIPELLGRRAAPVLRPDGTVFTAKGYDKTTKVWCDGWGEEIGSPSKADAAAALDRIFRFADAGQWESDADGVAWLAHVLTVAARPAIDGEAPAFVYSSPMPGSGKSTLARVAGEIGGRCAGYTSPGKKDDDEELARKLDTHALAPAIMLDNMRGVLASVILEGAIAGGVLPVRRLYVGHAQVPWRTVLSVTSNGAEIGRDWARRSVPVRLSGKALPGARDVLADAKATPSLTTDAVAVLGAWLRSGEASTCTPLLGFASWSRVVGGAIAWLGRGDVVAATREASEDMIAVGDDSGSLLDAIEQWLEDRGEGAEFTARSAWEAQQLSDVRSGFRDFAAFSAHLGRCSDKTRVLRRRRSKKARLWCVEKR